MVANWDKQDGLPGVSPTRSCIVSRERHDPNSLIRFVLSPAGEVVPDLARRLPGRGAWVTNRRCHLDRAISTRAFDRAWRRCVTVGDDLSQRVERLLYETAQQALSLANKAGVLSFGYHSVETLLNSGESIVLLQAHDAAADGRSKLERKYRAVCKDNGMEPIILDLFSVGQMSLAIGRTNVVHAAVKRGKAADALVVAVRRAEQFVSAHNSSEPGLARDFA
ncbi:MAG: RNA-binding protein [Hyphomicrobiaceae bacterium]